MNCLKNSHVTSYPFILFRYKFKKLEKYSKYRIQYRKKYWRDGSKMEKKIKLKIILQYNG